MSPTLTDIAKRTQTSVSTVSRVLAGGRVSQRISAATRSRILETAKAMGYRPNLMARGLRTRRSNTIALLVGDIANPWYGQLASAIEQHLHRAGYSLMLCNSGEDPQREAEYLDLMSQKGIDGLIVVPIVRSKKALYEHVPEQMPLVVLDRHIPGIDAFVASDEEQLGELLCDTLGRVLVRNVAIVSGPQYVVTHRRRAEMVARCFNVVGTHEGPARPETGRQAFIKFLEGSTAAAPPAHAPDNGAEGDGPAPSSPSASADAGAGGVTAPPPLDAIVCTNTLLGRGLIDAIASIERPPIIACFDEIPMAHLLPIPIVCTVQDVPMLAERCVAQLLPQLNRAGNGTTTAADPFHPQPILLPARAVTNRAFQTLQLARPSRRMA